MNFKDVEDIFLEVKPAFDEFWQELLTEFMLPVEQTRIGVIVRNMDDEALQLAGEETLAQAEEVLNA